ncbi:MAG: DUF2961 domain-containing protein [Armatimonadetes bacterium]|nr:DUF2961 domain-containing protein [Armatimonadota bacterium]
MFNALDSLTQLRTIRTKRISSYDRSGGNADFTRIPAGERVDIAKMDGAGVVKHIWVTISCSDPMVRRNTLLRMYWDGEAHPSVESPIGDFFGQGWGEKYNFASLPLAAAPVGGNALNCYFPMPFGDGARIEIENQCDVPIDSFYYYVDYEEHDSIGGDIGRFHAWWNRELTDPGAEDTENEWGVLGPEAKNPSDANNYLFLEAEGQGQFVGVNYFVDCPSPIWYGEGDDMFLIDGEPWPGSLHGTGTEDYFCSSWCPKEPYSHPFFGYPRVNNREGWLGRTHSYRFHVPDPIYFQKSIRASIEHGHANELAVDLSSVAYWYQNEPHQPFPAMRPKEERQNMPAIGAVEIHRWRDAWRKAKGGGKLWGNEG